MSDKVTVEFLGAPAGITQVPTLAEAVQPVPPMTVTVPLPPSHLTVVLPPANFADFSFSVAVGWVNVISAEALALLRTLSVTVAVIVPPDVASYSKVILS